MVSCLCLGADVHAATDACVPAALAGAIDDAQRRAATDRAWQWTQRLVLEVGQRPAGTAAEQRAAEWAATEMERAGLEDVRLQPFEFTGWRRGEARVQIVAPFEHELAAAALGGSVASPPAGVTAPVIRIATAAELDAAAASEIAGRIVFIDQKLERSQDRSAYVAARPARTDAPGAAARRGAVAVLIRSLGTDANRLAHVGMTRYPPDVTPIPALALATPDADLLTMLLARGDGVSLRVQSSAQSQPGSRSRNVVGDLRASGSARQIVLLAAHIDSWDVGLGASDDASGVGVLLAVADLLRAHRALLRRDVRFVFYGAEEYAGAGAAPYADAAADTVMHVAAIEEDLGTGRLWRLALPDGGQAPALVPALAAWLEPLGIALDEGRAAIGGTDLEPLRRRGVPVYDLDPDASEYFDVHHTDNDTLAHVSRDGLRQHVSAFASFALLFGGAPDDCVTSQSAGAGGNDMRRGTPREH